MRYFVQDTEFSILVSARLLLSFLKKVQSYDIYEKLIHFCDTNILRYEKDALFSRVTQSRISRIRGSGIILAASK